MFGDSHTRLSCTSAHKKPNANKDSGWSKSMALRPVLPEVAECAQKLQELLPHEACIVLVRTSRLKMYCATGFSIVSLVV